MIRILLMLILGFKPTEKQVDKILSARFLMAILFTSTYCLIIAGCTYAMIKKVIMVETGVALIAAFALVVREIASDYFGREDRKPEDNGKGEVKP